MTERIPRQRPWWFGPLVSGAARAVVAALIDWVFPGK